MATALSRHSDGQSIPVSFTLNGRLQELDVEPHELLLDVMRDRLGLTGASAPATFRSAALALCWSTAGQ